MRLPEGKSPRELLLLEILRSWKWQHRRIWFVMLGMILAAFALGAAGRAETSRSMLSALAFFGPLVVGVLSMSGIVVDEVESGLVLMWVQKAGSLARGYLSRYLIIQALLVAFGLSLGICIGVIGTAFSYFTVAKSLRIAACTATFASLSASMVFALSCWRVRRDSAVAVIIIVASISVGAAFVFDSGAMSSIARFVAFPVDPAQAIVEWPTYGGLARPIAILIGQLTLWNLAAVVGLQRTQRALS